jgi:hypothetical protein
VQGQGDLGVRLAGFPALLEGITDQRDCL